MISAGQTGRLLILLAKTQMGVTQFVGMPTDQDQFGVRVVKAQQGAIRAEKRPGGREMRIAHCTDTVLGLL